MDINNPKFKEAVEKFVQDILAGEASASASSKLEKVLNESSECIQDLKGKVTDLEKAAVENTTAVEDLEKVKTELETEVTALKEQVQNLSEEKTVLEERASKAEEVLVDIKKDRTADRRMAELVDVKVARSNEEAETAQRLYVRDMSDEEFASYKDERVSLREELLADIAQETADKKAKVAEGLEPAVEGSKPAVEKEVAGGGVVPPADIKGALEKASAVLPNAASAKEGGNWKDFGPALASFCKDKRDQDSKTKGQ